MQLRRQPWQDAADWHIESLIPGADGGEIGKFCLFKAENSNDPGHLVQDVRESSIRMIKVLSKPVKSIDHLVCVATVTRLMHHFPFSSDALFGRAIQRFQ